MSVQSIEWHEETHKNLSRSIEEQAAIVRREYQRWRGMLDDFEFHGLQIEEAKRLKKPGFDGDKFMKGKRDDHQI